MSYPWITQAMLESRLSAIVVRKIYDDNKDGTADAAPVNQLLADACSRIAGILRPIYDLDAVSASPPHEVIRLSLDAAVILAAQRFPSYVKRDWPALDEALRKDEDDLRKGKRRLDVVSTPEPSAQEGGTVRSGDPQLPEPAPRLFANGMGIF